MSVRLGYALLLALPAFACAPTYAPPVRAIHGGAPGHLDQGDMEVGVGVSGVGPIPGQIGGGAVAYAARPHLAVEGGVDATGGRGGWTMGWGGIRVPQRWHLRPRISLSADGELGIGAGVGGRNCDSTPTADTCDHDDIEWWQRPAGGGYLGAGAALRLGPVSLYSRGRLQMVGARSVPATQWASLLGGLHGHILRYADIWAGVAMVHYANASDSGSGFVTEVGLAFRFDPILGWR